MPDNIDNFNSLKAPRFLPLPFDTYTAVYMMRDEQGNIVQVLDQQKYSPEAAFNEFKATMRRLHPGNAIGFHLQGDGLHGYLFVETSNSRTGSQYPRRIHYELVEARVSFSKIRVS